MSERLLLDEHYSAAIAVTLRERGHDVVAVVADPDLRGASDAVVFASAAQTGQRVVTENIKDFRPLLLAALNANEGVAALLLVAPRRFRRGSSSRRAVIISALEAWLLRDAAHVRPVEDWLV